MIFLGGMVPSRGMVKVGLIVWVSDKFQKSSEKYRTSTPLDQAEISLSLQGGSVQTASLKCLFQVFVWICVLITSMFGQVELGFERRRLCFEAEFSGICRDRVLPLTLTQLLVDLALI